MTLYFRPSILISLFVGLLLSGSQASAQPNLIGFSKNGRVLNVSPNGQWLLSWDGVTQNTPATEISDHLVWNLATYEARDFCKWSEGEDLYDNECAWTPDNRIVMLRREPQHLADGNPPYTPSFYIQDPDGAHKIVCKDSNENYDEWGNYVSSYEFSADGARLFVLTGTHYRIFNARTGKLILRRYWASQALRKKSEFGGSLSQDGSLILASFGSVLDYDKPGINVVKPGKWALIKASSGQIVRWIKHDASLELNGFAEKDIFWASNAQWDIYYRLSTGKEIWRQAVVKSSTVQTRDEKVFFDLKTGQRLATLRPPTGAWLDMAPMPDYKSFFAIDTQGKIFQFPKQ